MQKGMTETRGADLGKVRIPCLTYLIPFRQYRIDSVKLSTKINRGWNDIVCARMLCPLRMLPKFDADPEG